MRKLKENKNGIKSPSILDWSDEEFNEWVQKQFLKEAEEIEKELEEIPDSEDWKPTEEKFQNLMSKAKERGVIKETDNSLRNTDDREKNTEEKVNDTRKPYVNENESERKEKIINLRRGVIKWTAVAAVTLFGIFGVSMTSEANRAYIMEEVNKLFGNDVNTKVNNDKVLESDRTEEYAREDIENTLGLKIPRLFYVPDDMSYQGYVVDEEAQIGFLQFLYHDQVVNFIVLMNARNASGLSQSDIGDKIKQISNEIMPELNIALWKIEEEGDENPTYSLRWKYKNSYYELFGKLPLEEMETIGENIMY